MTDNYHVLNESWKRERQRREIQPLPEGFYSAMATYITQLREHSRTTDKTSLRDKLIDKEREHAEKMLQELNQIRLEKLVTAELNGVPTEPLNLTVEEKILQVELRRLLATYTQSLKQALKVREQRIEPPSITTSPITPFSIPPQQLENLPQEFKIIRFLQPLPAIMGVDMKTYGPFKAEDVASIPTQNAENLIRKGIAKVVETAP